MTTAALPRLLTARELAVQTNYPLSRIYELTRDGVLPSIQFGRAYRYDPAAVRTWLDRGGTRSDDDPNS